jgi:uncharacterized membrane protein HdeD (DUF308 family)
MSINTTDDSSRAQAFFSRSIRDHWVLFLIEGVVLVLLGILAIAIPPLATLAVTILLGWLLLISGGVGLVATILARRAPGFGWSLLSALVGIVAGLVLLASPISGSVSLTLVLIAFFLIEGVASIMYAIEHRRGLSARWGWLLVSGIVDVILAFIVFAGLPGTALWAPGLLVGINMVLGGTALIAMALRARTANPDSA